MTRPETYGPLTKEQSFFEQYACPAAEERVIQFRETGEAISVWQLHIDGSAPPNEEIERQISAVFDLCGVPEDFYSHVRILKKWCETFSPDETTFAENKPSPVKICRWLSDIGLFLQDEPNDFQVGFGIETDDGLVVFKYQSEECAFVCDDCSDEMLHQGQSAATAQYSCDHNEGIYSYIFDYQISLYPKEDIEDINWYQSWPQNEP